MSKKGFTLTELLVVIAIIGILSVIIIPSVVKINKSINDREFEQRKTYIESAAEMYASDKPDIFQGGDVAYVYVWQLLQENYLNADSESEETCKYKADENGTPVQEENILGIGCVSDPRSSTSMNSQMVKLTRKTVGIVAELVDSKTTTMDIGENSLVNKVCEVLDMEESQNPGFIGQYKASASASVDKCKCVWNGDKTEATGLRTSGGTSIKSCILASPNATGNVDNWLKYGSSTANWRVVGLYLVPKEGGGEEVVAKIITSSVVD